jgi:hypothetical protein
LVGVQAEDELPSGFEQGQNDSQHVVVEVLALVNQDGIERVHAAFSSLNSIQSFLRHEVVVVRVLVLKANGLTGTGDRVEKWQT